MKTHRNGPSPLERALAAVDIPMVWRALNLPGEPGKSCRSPFRNERHPSFSVFDGGRKARDFGTGETFDTVSFTAAAIDSDNAGAARWLIEFAGTGKPLPAYRRKPAYIRTKAPARPQTEPPKPTAPLALPSMDRGTFREIRALAALRRLPFLAGLEILIQRGILRFGQVDGERAWIVTDAAARNAQARRLDGSPFEIGGRAVKAKTLPGSEAAWPIGAEDAKTRGTILFCEGGPDALAAATALFWERAAAFEAYGVCAMLGSSHSIPMDALPAFTGKRVRVYMHRDDSGAKAAGRWGRQLTEAGATVDFWAGGEGEDLNDYVSRAWTPPDEETEGGFAEILTPESKETPTNATPAGA